MRVNIKLVFYFSIYENIFQCVELFKYNKAKATTESYHTMKSIFIPLNFTTPHIVPIQWISITDSDKTHPSPEINDHIWTTSHQNWGYKTKKVNLRKWEPADTPIINNFIPNSLKECPHYKHGDNMFNINKMIDIWQTVYYNLKEKLHCFKIKIQKVSLEERLEHSKIYGDFDGKVKWENIFLEVTSMTPLGRKHFLQGIDEDNGVLDNIIIVKDSKGLSHVLLAESPDQWKIHKKLLLMRDCETGGVVIFSKVPHEPTLQQLKIALKTFGENHENGRFACEDDDPPTYKSYDPEDDHDY